MKMLLTMFTIIFLVWFIEMFFSCVNNRRIIRNFIQKNGGQVNKISWSLFASNRVDFIDENGTAQTKHIKVTESRSGGPTKVEFIGNRQNRFGTWVFVFALIILASVIILVIISSDIHF
jgi:hypothetical protein